jgi:hypothetical protein
MDFQRLILSKATYVNASAVATAAATHVFLTSGYKPPSQERYIDMDVVKNQNGQFKWVYDNGPGFKKWPPFQIGLDDKLYPSGASAALASLAGLWQHPGVLGMQTPEGTVHRVIWGDTLEQNFRVFPTPGKINEYKVDVQFEEA